MYINKRRLILTILVLFFCMVLTTNAQRYDSPDSTLQKIIREIEGEDLALSQAKQFAMQNATSVRRAEAVFLAAAGTLRRERGGFDPEFYFSLNYQDIEEPTASFFAGADILMTQQTTSQTGFRWKSPIGTSLELGLNATRLKTNSDFAFLNPQYNAFGTFNFRQPLLKGFTATGLKQLKVAEAQYEAAKARYEQEVIGIEAAVELAYWNLYSAERDYAVQKLTRDRAEAFLNETEVRHKAGLVGPNQVANAKTFLAQQELLLIDRKEELESQSDQLVVLLGTRPDEGFSRFVPVDEPPQNFDVDPVDEIIEKAKESNLELKAVQKEIDAAHTLVDASSWEALPSVDLVGSFVSNGLGGDSQDVVFGGDTLRSTSGGSFGDVLSQVFKRDYPGWSIGIEISLPIGLRPGLGEQDRLQAQAMNVEQRYIELSRILEQQVRTAHRELSNGNERLKAAAMGVEAAQEQVRIAMIEFQNGRITAFELVRLNEDFAVAQQRYSEALVRTVKAAALLKQLTSGNFKL